MIWMFLMQKLKNFSKIFNMSNNPTELLHAIGTLFGESQLIDRNIVEGSKDLRGTSNSIQNTLKETLNILNKPTYQQQPQPLQEQYQNTPVGDFPYSSVSPFTPDVNIPVEPPQQVRTSANVQPQIEQILLLLLQSIDTKLSQIISIYSTNNKNATKPRKRKPRKIPTES